MDNQQKANLYEQFLREYDEKARQVSLINSKFDLTKEDQKEIESLKKEMSVIKQKATSLGSI
jgi:cell shape-determining protein MreC